MVSELSTHFSAVTLLASGGVTSAGVCQGQFEDILTSLIGVAVVSAAAGRSPAPPKVPVAALNETVAP